MKKLMIGATIAFAAFLAIGTKRTLDLYSQLEKLKVRLGGITDIDISGPEITALIDIVVTNPTMYDMDISKGNPLTISKVFLYDRNGNRTAYAEPDLRAINIPALGEVLLTDIPVRGTFGSILDTLFSGSLKKEDFTVRTEIEILGRKFVI